jgi:hypothetical protein
MSISPRDLAVVTMTFEGCALPQQFHQPESRALSTIVSPRGLIISAPALPRYLIPPSETIATVSRKPSITYSPVFRRRLPQHRVINRPPAPQLLLLLPLPLSIPAQPDLLFHVLLSVPDEIQGEGAWGLQGAGVLPVAYDVPLPLPPPEPPPPFIHSCLADTCVFELCCMILTTLLLSSLSGIHLSIDSFGFPYLASRRR